jgi:hypothetical protein
VVWRLCDTASMTSHNTLRIHALFTAQIWMCLGEDLAFEDCDQACPGPGCHNVDCSTPMLYPGASASPSWQPEACSGPACRLRHAASQACSPRVQSPMMEHLVRLCWSVGQPRAVADPHIAG